MCRFPFFFRNSHSQDHSRRAIPRRRPAVGGEEELYFVGFTFSSERGRKGCGNGNKKGSDSAWLALQNEQAFTKSIKYIQIRSELMKTINLKRTGVVSSF